MSAIPLSTSRVVPFGKQVRFLDQVSGLSLDALVQLGQGTGLCPPKFSTEARKKEFFESADWGFLDFDHLGIDGAPGVDELDRRFESMGLRHATVLSKSHLKDKHGTVAERAHFLFPFARPCRSFDSFRETMRGLARRAELIDHVDPASFVANQPLWPGSKILRVTDGGDGLSVLEAHQPKPIFTEPVRSSFKSALMHARSLPPSVEGQSGRFALYAVANVIIHEDGLTADEAFDVIRSHFNPRCLPRWPERTLRLVIANAAKNDRHDPRKRRPSFATAEASTRTPEERACCDSWFGLLRQKLSDPDQLAHPSIYTGEELLVLVGSSGAQADRIWLGKVMERLGWPSGKRGRRQEKIYTRPETWTTGATSTFRHVLARIRGQSQTVYAPAIIAHTT